METSMSILPPIAFLIVAAGRGARFGGEVPKQYRELAGLPVLAHTLRAAARSPLIETILTSIHPEDEARYQAALAASGVAAARCAFAHGGASRQDSVRLGLEALARRGFAEHGLVLIHDAARPFLSEAMVLRAITGAARHGAVVPVLPVADTLATLDPQGALLANPDRSQIRIVQTPQAFGFSAILAAHLAAFGAGKTDFTDDAGVLKGAGQPVFTIAGEADLFKITLEADLARAERLLAGNEEFRAGIGYDVHAFAAGDHVMLGGVRVPHDQALLGHSDADPVLHALTDALLGTIGDGDIGLHFPPSDPQWRGAASHIFLTEARRRVEARGGRLVSVDCTIVCEAPKIGPHRQAIQAMIATLLALSPECVGVKATTSERLGFTGRREGIAAIAACSIAFIKP